MSHGRLLAETCLPGLGKPLILLDEILHWDEFHLRATKLISTSDFFLVGHFPEGSIYPGVMLVAAIDQAGVLLLRSAEPVPGQVEVRFLAPVRPGQLVEIEVAKKYGPEQQLVGLTGRARVDGHDVVRYKLTLNSEGGSR